VGIADVKQRETSQGWAGGPRSLRGLDGQGQTTPGILSSV
jgi:hypothetical protein